MGKNPFRKKRVLSEEQRELAAIRLNAAREKKRLDKWDSLCYTCWSWLGNSKIGKAAEADVIIGIGKEQTDTGEDNFLRYLYVSKNKLGGRHGRATVQIQPEVSRYTD